MAYNLDSLDGEVFNEISGLVDSGDIPSLHICVVSGDDKIVKGFGEQTGEDTVYLVGSIQKVFVAVSILQLYEDGLIGLDDDVNNYLSFSVRHPGYPDIPITIRMLLSHRSGLDSTLPSEFAYDWIVDDPSGWTRRFPGELIDLTLEEWLKENLYDEGGLFSPSHWVKEPGTGYSYSNNGYKILMCILEKVTGQSIQEYMDTNIFTPLQMDHTGFDSQEFMDEHAIPYTRRNGESTNTPLPVWNGKYMLRSSASDMGNLMIALMNGGVYDDIQILEEETVGLMFSNTLSSFFIRELLRKLKRDGYGLGIEVCNHGIMGHGGSTVGFTGEFYICPAKEVGVFRVSNVNAILDYRSRGWEDIGAVNNQITTLLMRRTCMLPLVDYIVGIWVVIILLFNYRKILEKIKGLTGVEVNPQG